MASNAMTRSRQRGKGRNHENQHQTASTSIMARLGFYHHGTIFHGALGSVNLYVVLTTCIFGCNGSRPLLDVPLLGPLIHIFDQTRKIRRLVDGMTSLLTDKEGSTQVNFDQYMQNMIETCNPIHIGSGKSLC